MAKVNIRPIAYRGTTAILPDLLAGRITMGFSNIINVAPLVRGWKAARLCGHIAQALRHHAGPADHGGVRLSGL